MRIAFYAPLKSPAHPVPSGDRRVARLYVQALQMAGHTVDLVSELRSHEPDGDGARQHRLAVAGADIGRELVRRWRAVDASDVPALWFTYHLYYKAADWIGPDVCRALGMPYVVAEPSFAAKRADGPWHAGHVAALAAIRAADLLLCPTRADMAGVIEARGGSAGVEFLAPFLDPTPYQQTVAARQRQRASLAARFSLPADQVWIVVAAMMRPGDKLLSYRMLADVLAQLAHVPLQVLVAGDGVARDEVQAMLGRVAPGRVHFAGECSAQDMAALYASCDLCVWPAVNEAYGMAMLEAQAAGLPVVSCATRGVPDVVCDGVTGILTPTGDVTAMANAVRGLVLDTAQRHRMGQAAARFVATERGIAGAARTLNLALGTTMSHHAGAPIKGFA